jgi:hypothetical protein
MIGLLIFGETVAQSDQSNAFSRTGLILSFSCLLILTITAVDLQLAAVYHQQQQQQHLPSVDSSVEQGLIRAVKAFSGSSLVYESMAAASCCCSLQSQLLTCS